MTKLTTDIINGAMYYIIVKQTMEDYLKNNPIEDEEILESFKEFWVELEKEIKDTKLP
jgi:uncharacterized protein YneF (UPF0154 family)